MIKRKILLSFLAFALALLMLSGSQIEAAELQSKRLWGDNRYATCVSIVQEGWNDQSHYAIIVNGENFPDALSASTLARKYNAPILLTENNKLDTNTYNQLKKLNVKHVFIVGGNFVVEPTVEQEVKNLGIQTERFKGQDRNETSVEVAKQIGTENGIILTTDSDFSDALSMAPIAAKLQIPIILIPKDRVPDSIKNFIASKNIPETYVLGDSSIISDEVVSIFPNTERITGNSKYERNINIIQYFNDKLDFTNVYFAYSHQFADALSGSALAGLKGNPIILVGDIPQSSTKEFLQSKISMIKSISILGGTAGVKDSLIENILDKNKIETEVTMTKELSSKLDDYFSKFAESNTSSFEDGNISDDELISFGITNIIKNHWIFNKEDNWVETRSDERYTGYIKSSDVDKVTEYYFGKKAANHKSIPYYPYDSGYYKFPFASGGEIDFAQVNKLYDLGNDMYKAEISNYSASSGFMGDTHGTASDWSLTDGENPPQFIKLSTAIIKKVNDNGSERYILLEYK